MGSFSAFKEHSQHDKTGNVFNGQIVNLNCKDTMVYSDSGVTVTCGLENIFVIKTGDKLLVIHKDHIKEMRNIINLIDEKGFGSYLRE